MPMPPPGTPVGVEPPPPGTPPLELLPNVALAPEQGAVDPMDEEALLAAVSDEVTWASQTRDQRVSAGEEALAYFYAELPAVPEGYEADCNMSDLVSTDVQDAVYAVCAEIMPAFSGQAPVEFQPLNAQDEAQAEVETKAVTHVAATCGAYMAIAQAVQDAMLRRAGVIKVYWEDRVEVHYEELENVPIMAVFQKLQASQAEPIEVLSAEVDEGKGIATVTLRRYRKRGRPRIAPVPIDEFLVSADLASPDVEEARFLAHQRVVSRSDLVELGLDPELVASLDTYELVAKHRRRQDTPNSMRSAHPSTEQVLCVEAYYSIDWDGDGIAERRRVITAGGAQGTDVLLLNDPWAEQPFAVGIGYLAVYDWAGVSLFDRLKAIQDAKTVLMRETLNTVRRNLRQRLGLLEGDANVNDALTSTMGGVIRMRTPNGVFPIPDVQLPATVFNTLEYLDGVRKDKGGGAIDATASAQVMGQGGDWSLERLMAATEQLNAMVAKNLVETLLKPMYRKLHNLLREYHTSPIQIPGSQGWRSTLPGQWTPREDMVVTMGMSVGERTQRLAALGQVLQQHAADMQVGMTGILSDDTGNYQARLDMARLSGLAQPERYFVDPRSKEAMAAKQQKEQAAAAAADAQREAALMEADLQYRLMTDIERIKADAKLAAQTQAEQTKLLTAKLDAIGNLLNARVKLADIETKVDLAGAQQEIDRLQMQAEAERFSAGQELANRKLENEAARVGAHHGTDPPPMAVADLRQRRMQAAQAAQMPPGGAPGPGGPMAPGPGAMPQKALNPAAQGAPQMPQQQARPQAPQMPRPPR